MTGESDVMVSDALTWGGTFTQERLSRYKVYQNV